jgi:hypothetical protein
MNSNAVCLTDAVGKTITAVEEGCDAVLISFADGSYSMIEATGDSSCIDLEPDLSIGNLTYNFTDPQIIRAGVATAEGIKAMREEKRRKDALRTEVREREQLARLQAKYGKSA